MLRLKLVHCVAAPGHCQDCSSRAISWRITHFPAPVTFQWCAHCSDLGAYLAVFIEMGARFSDRYRVGGKSTTQHSSNLLKPK
ncbi:uncharacterized protein ASCRUDRAFT_82561 [Ascoidea rubescens DSM 1968]|uniref:Uncharacterized protein n=1 Tax=Ascoidea rubescens DSM 1968 TaxID=1344418 RepID=A0A1D2VAC7_9ASCO|nr:hypothetical protein ASCRUDRAFT_82561 [Ascoidea rubescens DSM 1968]ODV58636.1 hypothetical protein ASCRUDRAFT_82561 [Ascoidea rubescens DSM 1968]